MGGLRCRTWRRKNADPHVRIGAHLVQAPSNESGVLTATSRTGTPGRVRSSGLGEQLFCPTGITACRVLLSDGEATGKGRAGSVRGKRTRATPLGQRTPVDASGGRVDGPRGGATPRPAPRGIVPSAIASRRTGPPWPGATFRPAPLSPSTASRRPDLAADLSNFSNHGPLDRLPASGPGIA